MFLEHLKIIRFYTFGIYFIDRYNRKTEVLISKELYINGYI